MTERVIVPEADAKLKPCPFCGSPHIRLHDNDWCTPVEWSLHCDGCGFHGPSNTDKKRLFDFWNNRASPNAGEVSAEEVELATRAAFNSMPWEEYSDFDRQNYIHTIERALSSLGIKVGG